MQILIAAATLAATAFGAHPASAGAQTTTSPMPRAAATPYTNLVWSDEFRGPAGAAPDPTKWAIKSGTPWNNGLNTYTTRASNVSTDGHGALNLVARKEDYTAADGVTRHYTSGAVLTKNKYAFTYGHLESRIWVPAGRGFWPAFWTLRYPIGAEIDAMEILGQSPSKVFWHVHSLKLDGSEYWYGTSHWSSTPLTSGYHVYGVTWEPDRISYQLDGVEYFSVAPNLLSPDYVWGFDQPEWIILNLGVGGNWPLPPDSTTPFPSRMKVDWVRVWQ